MKRIAKDGGPARLADEIAASTPSVPLPPPALLERAKKLGAISAGPAMFARATEPAAVPLTVKTPRAKSGKSAKAKGRRARR